MQWSFLFLFVLLLSTSSAIAEQTSAASSQRVTGTSTTQAKQTQPMPQAGSSTSQHEQANPSGGSPSSPAPGRTAGETPTQVQQALDKQLPAGSEVTASVADDGNIKLTGMVKTEADKAEAEQVARSVSGRSVNNKLQVRHGNDDPVVNPK